MPARTIGSYIIGKTLGEGASAKVKLGVHLDTGERVALKLVKSDAVLGDTGTRLVQREISAMLNLKHENVLCIKEVVYQAKYPKKNGQIVPLVLIVIEFAAGGELFEFLAATGPFDEDVARTYFKQLIAGVEYCHKQNVVHRDLKPENLLFDEHFTLKIADFGFSKVCEQTPKCMFTQCGSPGYMAPEIMLKNGYDAQKADIWACGVILFIMVAGFPPFQKPDSSDRWFEMLQTGNGALFWKTHSRAVNVSDELKALILRILCTDPTLRLEVKDIQASDWLQGPIVEKADLRKQLDSRKILVAHEHERATLVAKQQKEVNASTKAAGSKSNPKPGRTTLVVSVVAVASAAAAAVALAMFSPAPRSHGTGAPSGFPGPALPFTRAIAPSTTLAPLFSSTSTTNSPPPATSHASGIASAAIALFAAGLTTGVAWATKTAASARRRGRNLLGLEQYSSQIVHYTTFESEKEATALFEIVKAWVNKLQPTKIQCSPMKFKIKASVLVNEQEIAFRAQVYRSDTENSMRVVELSRMDGDGIQFRELFAQLKLEVEK